MGYYPQSFNKMCEKRLKLVENNISNKILELKSEGINLKFLKYKDNLDPKNVIVEKIIIILRDLDFNEIGEVKYLSFIRRGWKCKERKNKNLGLSIDEVNKSIKSRIKISKDNGINLKFLGFDKEWCGVINTIVIIQDLDYNEICKLKYSSFIRKGCTCQSRRNANRRTPRITESEAISNINNKIRDTKFIFLGFLDNKWLRYNTSLLFKDTSSQEMYSIRYSYFIKNGICSKEEMGSRISNSKRFTEDEGLKIINDHILQVNTKYAVNWEFLGFINGWHGANSKTILFLSLNKTLLEVPYPDFVLNDYYGIKTIKSKYEAIIEELLLVKFKITSLHCQYQIQTSDLLNRNSIFVDFYLSNENIIIEYDGQQHFNWTDHFHKTYSNFIDQVNRDNYLVQYCKDNNIRLLRISYKDNNRLEEVIKAFLVDGIDISTKVEPKLLPVPITYCKSDYGR